MVILNLFVCSITFILSYCDDILISVYPPSASFLLTTGFVLSGVYAPTVCEVISFTFTYNGTGMTVPTDLP